MTYTIKDYSDTASTTLLSIENNINTTTVSGEAAELNSIVNTADSNVLILDDLDSDVQRTPTQRIGSGPGLPNGLMLIRRTGGLDITVSQLDNWRVVFDPISARLLPSDPAVQETGDGAWDIIRVSPTVKKNDVAAADCGFASILKVRKPGAASAYDSPYYNLGTGDFTHECWLRIKNQDVGLYQIYYTGPSSFTDQQHIQSGNNGSIFSAAGLTVGVEARDSRGPSSYITVETVATSPIVLSGHQTINGVTTSTTTIPNVPTDRRVGTRVLVTNQANPQDNGIYAADVGPWRRLETNYEFRTNSAITYTQGDVDTNALILVAGGTYANTAWAQTNYGAKNGQKIEVLTIGSGYGRYILNGATPFYAGYYYNVPIQGGSGSGMLVDFTTQSDGSIKSLQVSKNGVGYQVGDILTLNGVNLNNYCTETHPDVSYPAGAGSNFTCRIFAIGTDNLSYQQVSNWPTSYVVGACENSTCDTYRLTVFFEWTYPSNYFYQLGRYERYGYLLGPQGNLIHSTLTIPKEQWTHIALSKENGFLRIFINGNLSDTLPIPSNISYTYTHPDGYWWEEPSRYIQFSPITTNNLIPGYGTHFHFNDFKYSKGLCRYKNSFTPPNGPLINDSNTTLLLRWSDPIGEVMQLYENGVYLGNITAIDVSGNIDASITGSTGYLFAPGHHGVKWSGAWQDGANYYASNSTITKHADIVKVDGALFVCKADHVAGPTSRPQLSTYEGDPTLWEEFWDLLVEPTTGNPHIGMKWAGEWADATEYFPATEIPTKHADLVRVDGGLFICIEQHTSTPETRPVITPPDEGEAQGADVVRVNGSYFQCIQKHTSGPTSKPQVPRNADYVIVNGIYYMCSADHISGPTSEPGAESPSLWQEFWDELPIAPTDGVWRGEWEEDEQYFTSTIAEGDPSLWEEFWEFKAEKPTADIVYRGDWTDETEYSPENIDETPGTPPAWEQYWEMVIEPSAELPSAEEKTFLENAVDGIYDWMKNATIGDWIKALLIGGGIVLAGAAILDAFSDDGSGDGTDPDSRYNGSPSYAGAYTPPSIRSVVESLCIHAGIASYDVSLLPDDKYCQFSLSQNTSIRNILENLAKAFLFDMVDSSGTLKFIPRNLAPVKNLTFEDLAFTSNGETISPITIKRLQSIDLPRTVSLTYVSEDLDYNNYTQMTEIPTFADGNSISLTVPFTMSHADAKATTEQLLIGAHLERMQYSFKTWYKSGIDLEPGDVVTLPTGDMARIIQIEEVEEGILEMVAVDAGVPAEPQPIVVGGVTIGYTASSYLGTGQDPQIPTAPTNVAPVITKSGALFIDPPVLNSDDTAPRVYAAIHGYGVEGWPGAQIFRSIDGGATYSLIGSTSISASWGLVSMPISAPTSYYTWDDTTVITVQMKTGTLVSKTDEAVLAGENLCMVGQECIAFGVATLVSPGTYQLSHLLRGRRGTEWATSGHVANELFVMLNNNLFKIECSDNDRGKTFKYKVVTYGSDLTKVDAQDIQIIGTNTVPWTPVNLQGYKVANDWHLSWTERPRFINEIQNYTEINHDYDFGGYAVIIYNGTTEVKQEIVYDNQFVYTSSMQIADFGSNQTTLKFAVSQISNKYGGGRLTQITV